MPADNLLGQTFCRLTVIERAANSPAAKKSKGRTRWLCNCSCGQQKIVASQKLKAGTIKSCGCYNQEVRKKLKLELVGQVFGRWTVVAKADTPKVRWDCKCACGTEKQLSGYMLRSGRSTSCGCFRTELLRSQTGEKNRGWKGGKTKNAAGYVILHNAGYPGAQPSETTTKVLEHVAVMARHLGRPLTDKETVHHKNGIRDDNRLENLELWSSNHSRGQRVSDLVDWATELLETYAPEKLAKPTLKIAEGTGT